MKCADPKLCYTSQKTRKFRHFSLSTPLFKQLAQQVFNCGTCRLCRKRASIELAMRCSLHASLYLDNCFLTLTYDEKKEGYHNELCYKDIQDFKKRFRRYIDYHYDQKIQIFNVHEYGKNQKKHWHLVVFNFNFPDRTLHSRKNGNPLYKSETLARLWGHGHCSIGTVTEASAMYTAQYTQKDFEYGNAGTKKKAKSNHSGIGRDYFNQNWKQLLSLGYVPFGGKKAPLPRYFLRLAKKHWAHFNEPDRFIDLPYRKKEFTAFRPGEANEAISKLYVTLQYDRNEKIKELENEWSKFLAENLYNDQPEFLTAAQNFEYDLKKRKQTSEF